MQQSAPSRVVILSSSAHEFASIDWDDLMLKKGYNSPRAYANSKLANIYHGKELGKRLKGKPKINFKMRKHSSLRAWNEISRSRKITYLEI